VLVRRRGDASEDLHNASAAADAAVTTSVMMLSLLVQQMCVTAELTAVTK
jgi:hypothetical protein